MALNFDYPALLEMKIVVEESIISEITTKLLENGFGDVQMELNKGEVALSGTMSYEQTALLTRLLEEFRKITGVRSVKNYVVELAPDQAMVNLTDQYEVTGYSNQGNVSLNVVINGRILTRGDILDGMTVTAIRPGSVLLERGTIKYKIDFKK